jgi:transposase
MAKVHQMHEDALKNPEKYANDKIYTKWISIEKQDEKYNVQVREEVVDNAKRYAGWMVLLSNHVADSIDAIRIYRAKDIVEKGFLKLKNSLDLGRLRVHDSDACQNKMFICFIALIMMLEIHNTMVEKELYKNWTMKQLVKTIGKRKVHKINNSRIEAPLTKDQRDIYAAFGLLL